MPTNKEYTFVFSDGTKVVYYLDENGLPYIIEKGKKLYAAIPLPQFVITDSDEKEKLNNELLGAKNDILSSKSIPTNYYELTVPSNTPSKSIVYSKEYSFANFTTHETPIFKCNGNHKTIRFRTTNLKKPLLGSKLVSFVIRVYSKSEKKWIKYIYNDQKCTEKSGFPFVYFSEFNYIKYTLLIPTDVTGYTGNFWTTYD